MLKKSLKKCKIYLLGLVQKLLNVYHNKYEYKMQCLKVFLNNNKKKNPLLNFKLYCAQQ